MAMAHARSPNGKIAVGLYTTGMAGQKIEPYAIMRDLSNLDREEQGYIPVPLAYCLLVAWGGHATR